MRKTYLYVLSLVFGAFTIALVTSEVAGSDPLDFSQSSEPIRVAITVDDIPIHGELIPGETREDIAHPIIKALKDNRVESAYGFTNGSFTRFQPEGISIFKDWLSAGYPLGNHGFEHLNLSRTRAYTANIAEQNNLLKELENFSPLIQRRKVFRYPYLNEGNTLKKRDEVRAYLKKNGYRIAEVTVDFHDWLWNEAFHRCWSEHDAGQIGWLRVHMIESADLHLRMANVNARRLFGRDIPNIVLLHLGSFNAVMLEALLNHWRSRGVRFVSLDEAMADPVYSINPNLAYERGCDFLTQIADSRHIAVQPFLDTNSTREQLKNICTAKPERKDGRTNWSRAEGDFNR